MIEAWIVSKEILKCSDLKWDISLSAKVFCCRLNFTVAETFGEEEESILQTATLWQNNISAIIGPIETCVHEVKLYLSRRLIGQLKPAID